MADKRDIQKRITSIRNRGAKIDRDIHETAVLTIEHARDHGDITLATKLVNAMPKSSRRKALIAWYGAFAPVTFQSKNEAFKLKKKRSQEDFLVDEANETPFWDYTKERNPQPYTAEKAINAFINGLKKAHQQGNLTESQNAIQRRLEERLATEFPS